MTSLSEAPIKLKALGVSVTYRQLHRLICDGIAEAHKNQRGHWTFTDDELKATAQKIAKT